MTGRLLTRTKRRAMVYRGHTITRVRFCYEHTGVEWIASTYLTLCHSRLLVFERGKELNEVVRRLKDRIDLHVLDVKQEERRARAEGVEFLTAPDSDSNNPPTEEPTP